MASELQFEAVVDKTQASKNPVSHYDRTVVFEFNTDEIKPIDALQMISRWKKTLSGR